MSWAVVFERLAREYGWAPATFRRLTIRQIQTYWQAMHARYTGERSAAQAGVSSHGKVTPAGARAPIEQSQTADGRTVRRYNLLAMWNRTRAATPRP